MVKSSSHYMMRFTTVLMLWDCKRTSLEEYMLTVCKICFIFLIFLIHKFELFKLVLLEEVVHYIWLGKNINTDNKYIDTRAQTPAQYFQHVMCV